MYDVIKKMVENLRTINLLNLPVDEVTIFGIAYTKFSRLFNRVHMGKVIYCDTDSFIAIDNEDEVIPIGDDDCWLLVKDKYHAICSKVDCECHCKRGLFVCSIGFDEIPISGCCEFDGVSGFNCGKKP